MTALLLAGLLHSVVCLILLLGYLRFFDLSDAPPIAAAEARVAPVSVAIFLGFISVVLGTAALKIGGARRWKAALALVSLLNALELWILSVDRQLYLVTRMHFDWRILSVLSQPDALEVIGLPRSSVTQAVALAVGSLSCSVGLCWLAVRLGRSSLQQRLRHLSARLGIAALALFVCDRSVYAVVAPGMMTERSDPSVVLPFADWLAVELPEDTVAAVFGLKGLFSRHEEFDQQVKLRHPSDLQYPFPKALAWRAPAHQHPNILVLALESLRADAVEPATMPNLYALEQKSWSARAHFSASNSTHLGLFSLIYGLSPTLWASITELSRPPFVYELLRRSGFELSVTSSSSPRWFGLDRQAMRRDLSLGKYDGLADPDEKATEDLVRFIRRKRNGPFFALLFFNGSHFPYYVPPGEDVFTPAASRFDFTDPKLREHRDEIINRYRNALHREDALLGQILEAIDRQGLGEETIIAVTGDHGESFWDDGRFAHTSLLSQAQLQVPLIIRLPGKAPRRIEFVTSHMDVMPTLLDAAGIDLNPATYSDGQSLLRATAGRSVLAAQFSADDLKDFALVDWPLLVRFRNRAGRISLSGAENLLAGQEGADAFLLAQKEKWPALLGALHRTARWWPGVEQGEHALNE